MKIVIAIDKFKGCATSKQLSHAIAEEIENHLPSAQIVTVPIADGGDGTLHAIKEIVGVGAKECSVNVTAPLQQLPQVIAQYIIVDDTAYMDLATASGLALVPECRRDVMKASTLGTGEMILHAINNGARNIVLGLGGSATCDAGMGILSALGFRFLDKYGDILYPCGANLIHVDRIDSKKVGQRVLSACYTLLSDVDNPLYGNTGAACVFAPQKGASQQQVEQLDKGLRHFATLLPRNIAHQSGSGAAGGVTAGMMAMLNATIKPGIDTLLELAHFDEIICDADLVFTGEGRIDDQTMHGKAPAGVLKAAQQKGIPVIALCGSVAPGTDTSKMGFQQVVAVTPVGTPIEEAMRRDVALRNVAHATRRIISKIKD